MKHPYVLKLIFDVSRKLGTHQKRLYLFMLSVIIMLVAVTSLSFANTDEQEFDIITPNGGHITYAILVEDGIAYELTEEEYINLMEEEAPISGEELEGSVDMEDMILPGQIPPIGDGEITPLTSYYYKFLPSGTPEKYWGTKKRVSALYKGAKTLRITSSMTCTSSVKDSGG